MGSFLAEIVQLSDSDAQHGSIVTEVKQFDYHCNDVIMSAMASQITSLAIVYSVVYLGVDQRKLQISASLAFESRIHRGTVNSRTKGQ